METKLRRSTKVPPWLILTPFIDVLLVLICFILSISFNIRFAVDVSLPESSSGQMVQNDALTVIVRRDGELVVEGKVVSSEGFPAVLDEILRRKTPKKAFIQGDEEISYQTLIGVMDELKNRGIQDLSLLTKEKGR